MNANLPAKVTRTVGMSKLIAKKYSPEILLGLGIAGVVASSVMLVRATLKVDDVKARNLELLDTIEITRERVDRDHYTDEDYQNDLKVAKVTNAVEYIKLYGPAVSLGIAGLVSIVGSHGIMNRRAAAMVAAYGMLQEGFTAYRARVVEELGVEKDNDFRYGLEEETVTIETIDPETGKKKKTKKTVKKHCEGPYSIYARLFDEANSTQYRRDPKLNLFFVTSQQNYANDLLKARGYLFLNEVYNMLGMDWTPAGQIVGWIWGSEEEKDTFVDFGLGRTDNQAFVLGLEDVALLDFNVDGPIYELI